MLPDILGPRVKLRPLRRSDAPSLYKYARNREISRWTYVPHPYRPEHAEQFLDVVRLWSRKKIATHFGIVWRESDEVIGVVGLFDIDQRNKRTEIGYWLGLKYRGMGVATEAVSLTVKYCFETLKLHRVYAHVFIGNTASERLLLNLGFKFEGLERESRRRRGRWMDTKLYAVLKNEFHMPRQLPAQSHLRDNVKK
ncbi:MAG: GNAT family N-acetyltransferase [bacterium]|nr:GNAT family N-acetyltransferase [bacterium]